MTTLDDERIDQRLRRAGERLRHEAPDPRATSAALETLSLRPPERRHRRWITPIAVVAVAASVIAVLVFAGTREETVEQRPADVPFEPPADVSAHVYAVNHDGAGGNCVALVGQDGIPSQACLAGDQAEVGRAVVTAVDGQLQTIVSPGHTGPHAQEDDSCFGDLAAAHRGRFVDVVTCGDGQPVFGLLPVEPGGEAEWFVRSATGRDVGIELVSGDGVTFLFEAPDPPYRPCRVIATQLGAGGWVDACSPLATVRALSSLNGAVYLIERSADAPVWLGEDQGAALGCSDLPSLLDATRSAGGVTVRLTCQGDLAVAVQGSAELAMGRAGTWAIAVEHSASGWRVVAEGATLPCAPANFCDAFGPADDLARAAQPIPPL